MKKYIICDGDQTLYRSVKEPISDKMMDILHRVILKGYGFGVISGTDSKEIARLIRSDELGMEHHILANSGTSYYRYNNGKLNKVYELGISQVDKRQIINALELLIKKYNIKSMTSKEDQILDRGSQITLSAIGRNAPVEMKDVYDPDRKRRTMYVDFLRRHLSEDKYSIKIGGTTSIDITLGETDKARGIELFVKENKLKLEDITFYGDKLMPGGNDYSVTRLKGVKCISVDGVDDTLNKLTELISFKMPYPCL